MKKRAIARFCVLSKEDVGTVKAKKQHRMKKADSHSHRQPVNEQNIVHLVKLLAEPLCESEGLELVHVEFQRESSGRILRLYIDKPSGISLNDCADISHQIGDLLDIKLENVGPYRLEVTSPGPDRPLAKQQDFEKYKGSRIKIKTSRPLNGQKNFTGVLLGIFDRQVKIQVNGETIAIPFQDILKARLAK
jgi:ribosome maturation factor RimP